jgi:hypothetical protein
MIISIIRIQGVLNKKPLLEWNYKEGWGVH